MSSLFDNAEVMEALALEMGPPPEIQDEQEDAQSPYELGWRPSLNPIQKKAIADEAIYKLYYGERGTGKSIGALHELVEYVHRNENCLGYIIVKEIGMATQGGAWHKLQVQILPEWKAGNNLIFTESRLDSQTKNPYIWIRNKFNGWSMIMLASLPVAHQVEAKIRGREPQIIFVDEAQVLDTDTYFSSLIMQLGRRPGSTDRAKIIFCCNPEGPSHWLYHRFFELPVNEETGEWDVRYAHWHIPISDNVKNLPPGYYEDYVLPAVKNDPILEARLVRGEWVDRPDGDSLFAGYFVEGVHVKGNAFTNQGITPVAGVPVIVSYDPGAAHTVVYFEQVVPTLDKVFKLVIDEIDHVGHYTPYTKLVPEIIDRMIYWDERMKAKYQWIHVSDDSAFNQYRAATGSFDAWDIEKISKAHVAELKKKLESNPGDLDKAKLAEQLKNLDRYVIKMKAAPKGDFSIEARTRMINEDLVTSSFMISAPTCRKGIEMFMRLTHEPDDALKPKKKSRYGHNHSAMTYGFFWAKHRPSGTAIDTDTVTPQYWAVRA